MSAGNVEEIDRLLDLRNAVDFAIQVLKTADLIVDLSCNPAPYDLILAGKFGVKFLKP